MQKAPHLSGMCVPQVCLADDWQPSIKRNYTPPRGGWTIHQLPESLEEELGSEQYSKLAWAWANRPRKAVNQHWNNAVSEVTSLLKLNGVNVTKGIRGQIRFQAEREWCARDPERCSKQALKNVMIQAQPMALAASSEEPLQHPPVKKETQPCRSC